MSVGTKERRTEPVTGHRQDAAGAWHVVRTAPCDGCGCPWDYSVDEVGLVWEPGPEIDDACTDPQCDCHVAPIRGMPFRVRAGR
jgi:hypothetical protein